MELDAVFARKRVLVTGHTGFKGSWLSFILAQLGAQVTGFADGVPTQPSNFQTLNLENQLVDLRGDIRSYRQVHDLIQELKPQIIFHLAAQALVRTGYALPRETFEVNIGGTVNLLEAVRVCRSVEAVVVVTSDKCYDVQNQTTRLNESAPLGGRDPYGASKACAEVIFHCYVQSFFQKGGPAVASARAGNVIGGGDWAQDRLVPDCVRSWSRGETVAIRNPGVHRPWQSIFDVLEGYLKLAGRLLSNEESARGQSFNFGPPPAEDYTVSDVVETLSRFWKGAVGLPERFEDAAWRKDVNLTHKTEGPSFRLDSAKARRELQWQPRLNTEMTLKLAADWYTNFYGGHKNMIDFSRGQLQDFFKTARLK